MADEICGGNIICAFDIAATLMPDFGQNTLQSLKDYEEEKTIVGKSGRYLRQELGKRARRNIVMTKYFIHLTVPTPFPRLQFRLSVIFFLAAISVLALIIIP